MCFVSDATLIGRVEDSNGTDPESPYRAKVKRQRLNTPPSSRRTVSRSLINGHTDGGGLKAGGLTSGSAR